MEEIASGMSHSLEPASWFSHLEPCGIVVESGLSSEERERKAWDINLPFAVGESSYFPVAFFFLFFINAVLSSELCVLGGYS